MFTRVSTVVGKVLLAILGTVLAIVILGGIWFKLVVPAGHFVGNFVGNLFTLTNRSNTQEIAQPTISNTNNESNGNQGTGSTAAAAQPEVIPAANNSSSLDSFPSTAYTVVMQFKDGTELTKTLMTDLDLEDDKQTWDRIQKVGIADLIVTNSTPVLFFYNGYVMPVSVGENQSLGEIWETAMSNDPEYNSGFALRQLANGCSSLSSTWIDAEGISHTQAQTAVTEELATWLVNYCDAREITEWKNDRASLGMPESLFTK